MKSSLRMRIWMLVGAAILAGPAPAFSSFNLDYSVVGRIWIPSLSVELQGLPTSDRVVALSDFGDCIEHGAKREDLLEPRERDCRFERQLADVLVQSAMFRAVVRVPQQSADVDLVLSPLRSRVQFRRQVIPAVKPFVVLTLFTYLWTPLPFEVDVESYDLRVAIHDRRGQLLADVTVAREFSHYLSSYSAERTAPADLLTASAPTEREIAPVIVCRGPHAAVVVRELLEKLGATVTYAGAQESGRGGAADDSSPHDQ